MFKNKSIYKRFLVSLRFYLEEGDTSSYANYILILYLWEWSHLTYDYFIAPLKADLSCCSKRLKMLTVWEVKWRPPPRTLMALANNTFLLSYSPMPRSQVWILNYLVHGSSKITLLPYFLCFAIDARSRAGDSPYKIAHNDWLKIFTCCLLPWRNIDSEPCTQIKTWEPFDAARCVQVWNCWMVDLQL